MQQKGRHPHLTSSLFRADDAPIALPSAFDFARNSEAIDKRGFYSIAPSSIPDIALQHKNCIERA
jgi:hypothetical protein